MVVAKRSLVRIFVVPSLIAGIVAVGLISALLGDDIWDRVSWVALAVPLLTIAICLGRRVR
jgi:hypothetical protein